jgi:hypothetical protein
MEKLSDGYYYEVFDLKNGRVLKKKKTFSEVAKSMGGMRPLKFYRTWKHIRNCENTTKEVIKRLPLQLIGNPSFVNKTNYEQDKVVLLMEYFESHNLEENKRIVDSYIDLIKTLLLHGVHDHVYKFKNSYGIDKNGKVICIDFNEMTFSKDEVITLAQEERWRTEAQFTKLKEGELKKYLAAKFKETLERDVINDLWNTSRNKPSRQQ